MPRPPKYTDEELAAAVRAQNFKRRDDDGQPVLPPRTVALGQRLLNALVTEDGTLASPLGPLTQGALEKEGFRLKRVEAGRVGLAADTQPAGGRRQKREPTADAELAAAVQKQNFEWRDGQLVLPATTGPLGRRLSKSIVGEDGSLHAALGPLAQKALEKKGFRLEKERVKPGRVRLAELDPAGPGRMGLAASTQLAGPKPKAPVTNTVQYAPPAPTGASAPSGTFGAAAPDGQPVPVADAAAAAALNTRPSLPSLPSLRDALLPDESIPAQGPALPPIRPVIPSLRSLQLPEPDRRNPPPPGPAAPAPYRPGTPELGRGGPAGRR